VSHLLAGGIFGMVFKKTRNSFDLENSLNGFIQLHQLCSNVVVARISGFVAQVFGVNQLLALAKPFGGICPILVGETF
jgi:hypothetical protein